MLIRFLVLFPDLLQQGIPFLRKSQNLLLENLDLFLRSDESVRQPTHRPEVTDDLAVDGHATTTPFHEDDGASQTHHFLPVES